MYDEEEKCSVCDGKGRVECDPCGGSGYDKNGEPCQKCGAHGMIGCDYCHGTGTV